MATLAAPSLRSSDGEQVELSSIASRRSEPHTELTPIATQQSQEHAISKW